MSVHLILYYLTLVVMMITSIFGVNIKSKNESLDLSDYKLVWQDNFNGSTLNTAKWTTESGTRRGGYWDSSQVFVKNGNLIIRTEYQKKGSKGAGYYAGSVKSKKTFKKGYYEIRCIQPAAKGMWSAFWLYCDGMYDKTEGGKNGTEIDIFESPYFGSKLFGGVVQSTIYYDGYENDGGRECVAISRAANQSTKSIYTAYHTYGLMWSDDEYIFYIDDEEIGRTQRDDISDVYENIILSTEVGGEGGVPGKTWLFAEAVDDEAMKTDFIIDYVRVYQAK